MFLQNERGLGVKNGTLGTIEQVCARSISVRANDGRNVSFDLKKANKFMRSGDIRRRRLRRRKASKSKI